MNNDDANDRPSQPNQRVGVPVPMFLTVTFRDQKTESGGTNRLPTTPQFDFLRWSFLRCSVHNSVGHVSVALFIVGFRASIGRCSALNLLSISRSVS
jgi:hypothetical protein